MTNNQQPTPLELFDKGQDDDPVGNGWRGYSWTQNEVDIIRKALSSLGSQTDVDVKFIIMSLKDSRALMKFLAKNEPENSPLHLGIENNEKAIAQLERGLLKTGERC